MGLGSRTQGWKVKVFVAGARNITELDFSVQNKLSAMINNGYDIIVGDCFGIDALVQKFCNDFGYRNVTVYASNGHARNNIGNWKVKDIYVPPNILVVMSIVFCSLNTSMKK